MLLAGEVDDLSKEREAADVVEGVLGEGDDFLDEGWRIIVAVLVGLGGKESFQSVFFSARH